MTALLKDLHSNKLRLKLDIRKPPALVLKHLHSNKLRLKRIPEICTPEVCITDLHSNKLRLKLRKAWGFIKSAIKFTFQ